MANKKTKSIVRRGRERRIQLARSNKKMAGLSKRLEKAKKDAAEKFGKAGA